MLFSDGYLLRTRITFLTNYDLSVRTSVDSTDSTVNHHIKAMYSAFHVLGSLHFPYTGLTYAFGSNQCAFLHLLSGATITARPDAVIHRDVKLPRTLLRHTVLLLSLVLSRGVLLPTVLLLRG